MQSLIFHASRTIFEHMAGIQRSEGGDSPHSSSYTGAGVSHPICISEKSYSKKGIQISVTNALPPTSSALLFDIESVMVAQMKCDDDSTTSQSSYAHQEKPGLFHQGVLTLSASSSSSCSSSADGSYSLPSTASSHSDTCEPWIPSPIVRQRFRESDAKCYSLSGGQTQALKMNWAVELEPPESSVASCIEPPAGLSTFACLTPSMTGYDIVKSQTQFTSKMKPSRKFRARSRFKSKFVTFWARPLGKDTAEAKKLRAAVSSGDVDTVENLLTDGVDPNVADQRKRTAIHMAAAKGDVVAVRLLLNNGADVDVKDCLGNTPLHLACCGSNIPVVTQLLQAGASVTEVDCSGRTPLHLANSRLTMIEASQFPSDRLRVEVEQIIAMLKEFVTVAGRSGEAEELEELFTKLQCGGGGTGGPATPESAPESSLGQVHDMLARFTTLCIHRREKRTLL